MPNRVIKEKIWTNPRLARCSLNAQLHYPRLLLLYDDYGCLDLDIESIRGKVYSKLLNVVSLEDIEGCLNEYVAKGLLFVWSTNNTEYGYFTGEEEGRLPALSRRHKRTTPPSPEELLKKYIKDYSDLRSLPTEHYKVGSMCLQVSTKVTPNPNPNPNPKKEYVPTEVETSLALLLKNKILSNNPKAKIKENGWAKDVDLMIRVDNRTPEEIKEVIEFSQSHEFWWKNILSMGKLRKQFDKLTNELRGERENGKDRRNSQKSGVEYPVDIE